MSTWDEQWEARLRKHSKLTGWTADDQAVADHLKAEGVTSKQEVTRAIAQARFERSRQRAREAVKAAGSTEDEAKLRDQVWERAKLGHEFLNAEVAKVSPVWGTTDQAVWTKGESLMIVAPPGVGKTTVAGQLVRARMGLQAEVLGFPVADDEGVVLYVAADRPAQIARSMWRAFALDDEDVIAARLRVWEGPPPRDLARHPDTLRIMADEFGATTVVLDSIKDMALGVTDDEVGSGYNRARQLVLTDGVQLVELHHQKKHGTTTKYPDQLSDVYGSTWLTAGAGSVVLLWGEAGDPVVSFRHLKQPAAEVGPFEVLHDHDAGMSTIYEGTDLVSVVRNGAREKGTDEGMVRVMTAREAATALYGSAPTRAQVEKARRNLDKLVVAGRVEKLTIPGGYPPAPGYRVVESEAETDV